MAKYLISIFLLFGCSVEKKNEEFVNVSGTGTLQTLPDKAKIFLGVSSINDNADSSVKKVRSIEKRFLELCNHLKVKDENISTQINSVKREYKNSKDTTTYLGIKSEIIYKVYLTEINKVDEFLSKSFLLGINEFRDFEWQYSKQDSIKREASKLAMFDAKKNALVIVENSNRKINKLISASYEKPGDFDVRSRVRMDDMLGGLLGGDDYNIYEKDFIKYFKMIPERINVKSTVYVKYSIK